MISPEFFPQTISFVEVEEHNNTLEYHNMLYAAVSILKNSLSSFN